MLGVKPEVAQKCISCAGTTGLNWKNGSRKVLNVQMGFGMGQVLKHVMAQFPLGVVKCAKACLILGVDIQ